MTGAMMARMGIFNSSALPYVSRTQQVSITIPSGATSATATISAVDTSKTIMVNQGLTVPGAASTQGATNLIRIELTNSTTITAYRNTSSTDALVANAVVVEGTTKLISSIQYGTINVSAGTSNTATITSVDLARSAVFWLGQTTTSTASSMRHFAGLTLTNATTVTADIGAAANVTAGYCVVEFASAAIQSVQQVADAYTSANTTDTKTISAVVMANTMIANGGQTNSAAASSAGSYTLQLTSTTNIDLIRGGTVTTTRSPYYTVVEFASGVLNASVQRGTISLISVTSNTATISALTNGFANYVGSRSVGGGYSTNLQKLELTNSTTITASRAVSSGNANDTAYEAIGFN